MFHNRRWDGDFKTISQILEQGLLGQLKEVAFHWDGFDPVMTPGNWREGDGEAAGVLYDLGVHFFDQALCLFGQPQTIFADIQNQREGTVAHDYFNIILGYEDHLKVHLRSSRFVREKGPRFLLHGTKGSYIKYGTDPQEIDLIKGQTPDNSESWGIECPEQWGTLNTMIGALQYEGTIETLPGSYTSFYDNIYETIVGKSDLIVKPAEARMAIRLIELALQSHEEGRIIKID